MKKIKFLMCAIIALSVLILPFTAFGAVTSYNSGIRWADIIEDNGFSCNNYYIWCDSEGYTYIAGQNKDNYNPAVNSTHISDVTNIIFTYGGYDDMVQVYKSANPYNPYGTYSRYGDTSIKASFPIDTLYANDKDILYYDGSTVVNNVVFQRTPYTQQTAGQGGQETSPTGTATSRRLSGVMQSGTLNGVLIEVISILPILLPVLVVFLAIRKGLAFTLGTLRAS